MVRSGGYLAQGGLVPCLLRGGGCRNDTYYLVVTPYYVVIMTPYYLPLSYQDAFIRTTHHLLATTHYLLVTTHYLPLITHYPQLTTHYLPPTTHDEVGYYSLLTTYYS